MKKFSEYYKNRAAGNVVENSIPPDIAAKLAAFNTADGQSIMQRAQEIVQSIPGMRLGNAVNAAIGEFQGRQAQQGGITRTPTQQPQPQAPAQPQLSPYTSKYGKTVQGSSWWTGPK